MSIRSIVTLLRIENEVLRMKLKEIDSVSNVFQKPNLTCSEVTIRVPFMRTSDVCFFSKLIKIGAWTKQII